MSRSRELLKSLVGPHVLFAFALGLVQALRVVGAGNLALAVAFATVAGAAAILAKRLTGNALVSACAGGIMALHPAGLVELLGPRILDVHVHDTDFRTFVGLNLFSASCGLLAAGIRLLPSRELEDAPLFGWREWAALALLVVGAIAGPAVMAMPLLILAADLAFAPAGPRTVLRRTGKHFFLHAGAVIPAWLFASPFPEQLRPLLAGRLGWIGATERPLFVFAPGIAIDAVQGSAVTVFPLLVIGAIASVAVLLFRQRVSQTLIVVAAFAIVWTTVAELPRLLHPAGPLIPNTVLIVFGVRAPRRVDPLAHLDRGHAAAHRADRGGAADPERARDAGHDPPDARGDAAGRRGARGSSRRERRRPALDGRERGRGRGRRDARADPAARSAARTRPSRQGLRSRCCGTGC